jgi:integrase
MKDVTTEKEKMKIFKHKLTQEFVEDLKSETKARIFDTEIPNFYLQCFPSGRKSFYLYYRNKITKIANTIKIGKTTEITTKDARNLAFKLRCDVNDGRDPVLDKKQKILDAKKQEQEKITTSVIIDEYLKSYCSTTNKRITSYEKKIDLEKHIKPMLGNIPIIAINGKHLLEIKDTFADKKATANKLLAFMSNMLNWCEVMGYRPINSNPSKTVKKFKIKNRDRVVSIEEYARVFEALEKGRQELKLGTPQLFDVIEFIIKAGCRKSEGKDLKWSEVDFDCQVLRLKDSKTGQKTIPISDACIKILKRAEQYKCSAYVFPSPKNKDKPYGASLSGKRVWDYIVKEANLSKDVTLHTFRHSFATHGAMMGKNAFLLQKILGHSSISTTNNYIHANDKEGIETANSIINSLEGKAYMLS